jgi:predicted transcriptional regulator YheO
MNKELKHYFAIAEAISTLFYPHVEVVIHDLRTGCIVAIFNNFSKRKVGDESLLSEDLSRLPDIFPPYTKVNWDGRKLKSVTATVKNQNNTPIGLFCINFDISKWKAMHHLIGEWIQLPADIEKPEVLFEDDWRERINTYVSNYLQKQGISIAVLAKDRSKKKELVHILHAAGAFKAKHAASYVAEVLCLSRATIYNYLATQGNQ